MSSVYPYFQTIELTEWLLARDGKDLRVITGRDMTKEKTTICVGLQDKYNNQIMIVGFVETNEIP
jgi:hypothetical protein